METPPLAWMTRLFFEMNASDIDIRAARCYSGLFCVATCLR